MKSRVLRGSDEHRVIQQMANIAVQNGGTYTKLYTVDNSAQTWVTYNISTNNETSTTSTRSTVSRKKVQKDTPAIAATDNPESPTGDNIT